MFGRRVSCSKALSSEAQGQFSDMGLRYWAPCLNVVRVPCLGTLLLESLRIPSLTGCPHGGHGPDPRPWQLPGSTLSFPRGRLDPRLDGGVRTGAQ